MWSNLLSKLLFAEKVISKFDIKLDSKFNSKFGTGDTLLSCQWWWQARWGWEPSRDEA